MISENDYDRFIVNVYMKHAKKLERLCFAYVGYHMEYQGIIDECIQDTFLQAYKECTKLIEYTPEHIEAWLVSTCWNRLRSALRKYRSRKKHHIEYNEFIKLECVEGHSSTPVDKYLDKQANEAILHHLLKVLNERERDVITLHFIQGVSLTDIATQNHASVGAIKAVLARARSKLRKTASRHPDIFLVFFVSLRQLLHFIK